MRRSSSECVIKQIRDRKSRFETFVANRLSKIHADSEVEEWHYVPTDQNPADFTSRGLKPKETEKWDIFHYGPKFLRKKEGQYGKLKFLFMRRHHKLFTEYSGLFLQGGIPPLSAVSPPQKKF